MSIVSAPKRTKIIATLGPATDDPLVFQKTLKAGVDAVRLNFSHGVYADHARRAEMVRRYSAEMGSEIAIIADLQGPKIRIARFVDGPIHLVVGATFILDAALPKDAGTVEQVGIDYAELPNDVHIGDTLLIDDGRLVLEVLAIQGTAVSCRVIVGGALSNNKGINRQGGGLSASALTEKDITDIQSAVNLGVDYIAVSFPRSAEDMCIARRHIQAAGGNAGIIAKIERAESLDVLDEIIEVSDAVMVARGDLGVEIGDAELPRVQKHIIQRARALNRVVITATQMMESMIVNAIPTRAEVFDVANAVLDGTDAVMLSAETASGAHPDIVVEAMARICLGAERQPVARISKHRVECEFMRTDEAIAMAAMYTANHFNIKAIIAFTESGGTPLWMSRIRSGIPIFGFSGNVRTLRRMNLYRGVYPIYFDAPSGSDIDYDRMNREAIEELSRRNLVVSKEFVIVTFGDRMGVPGGSNNLKILQVS